MVGIKIAYLLVSVLLALGLGGALAQYEFGSKVASGDSDENRLLDDFAVPQAPIAIGYWDVGTVPGFYDEMDPVYLHLASPLPGNINANDVRLTPYGIYPAGSKVTSADNDINKPLFILPGTPPPLNVPPAGLGAIYYNDLFGTTPGYDSGDSVYIKGSATGLAIWPFFPTITTNDIRITPIAIATGLLPGGAKVRNLDPDNNNLALPMVGLPLPPPGAFSISTIRFYNKNGNTAAGLPLYDYPDVVYIDTPWTGAAPGTVSPNDVRLTIE